MKLLVYIKKDILFEIGNALLTVNTPVIAHLKCFIIPQSSLMLH